MNAEKAVWKVLAYIVKDRGEVFVKVSKNEFTKAHYELTVQGIIPKMKQRTLLRVLRQLAHDGSQPYSTLPIKYFNKRKGIYLVEVPGVIEKAGGIND